MQCTFPITVKKLAKVGDWNRSKIVFDNGHVEYWLNDQKLLEFEAWTDDWFARKEAGNGILLRNTDLPAAVLSHFRITEAEPGSGILR